MLPWSVMPIAGWPSAAAAATTLVDPATRRRASSTRCGRGGGRSSPDPHLAPLPSLHTPLVHRPGSTACGELHRCDSRVDRASAGTCPATSTCRVGHSASWAGAAAPGGSWPRICSSCWRAAICWANSVAWMPWKSPSSQPTSWAWATRSSASVGVAPTRTAGPGSASSSRRSGDSVSAELLDRLLVDRLQPVAAGLVERRRPHLLEQLLDHRADPHDLRRRAHRLARSPSSSGPAAERTTSGCSGGSDMGGDATPRRVRSYTRGRRAAARRARPAWPSRGGRRGGTGRCRSAR